MSDEKKSLDHWLGENHLLDASGGPAAPDVSAVPTAISVLEQVEKSLRETLKMENITIDAVEQTARLTVRGDQTEIRSLLKYDPDAGLLSIRCYFNAKIPLEKMDAVLILASLKNRYYRFGADVVFDEGYVHEGYLWVQNHQLDSERVCHLTYSGFNSVDEAFPMVMAVIYGGKSPAEVVAEQVAKRNESSGEKT